MFGEMVKFEMDLKEPTPELFEYAKENLNEDPDTKLEVLAEFRDLIFGKLNDLIFSICRREKVVFRWENGFKAERS